MTGFCVAPHPIQSIAIGSNRVMAVCYQAMETIELRNAYAFNVFFFYNIRKFNNL